MIELMRKLRVGKEKVRRGDKDEVRSKEGEEKEIKR